MHDKHSLPRHIHVTNPNSHRNLRFWNLNSLQSCLGQNRPRTISRNVYTICYDSIWKSAHKSTSLRICIRYLYIILCCQYPNNLWFFLGRRLQGIQSISESDRKHSSCCWRLWLLWPCYLVSLGLWIISTVNCRHIIVKLDLKLHFNYCMLYTRTLLPIAMP